MHDLLELLPEDLRADVLRRGRRRAVRRQGVVMHEGDPADSIHLIVKGCVGVRVTTPRGDEATIALRGRGDVIGEMALVGREPARRSASVIALVPSETIEVSRTQFDRVMAQVPTVSAWLLDMLAERLREASGQLRDAHYESADVRVLRRLLRAADQFASHEIPLTQDDLAAMAGTTRPTVNRALRAAEDRGWLSLRRGIVEIHDLDAIRDKAGVRPDDWSGMAG